MKTFDILDHTNWSIRALIKQKVLTDSNKSALTYTDVFCQHFQSQNVTVAQLQTMHQKDNDVAHQCLPFIFQIRDQTFGETPLMFLLGGKPLIYQGKSWNESSTQGERRMRNISIGIRCASIKAGTQDAEQAFKNEVKHSKSLFFTNASIFLVRTSDQGRSSTKVSKELKDLAEKDLSYKITNAEMFHISDQNHIRDQFECKGYHVFCADKCLCIEVIEDKDFLKAGDTTNYLKALEDDFVKLVAKSIFNDKSFATSCNYRCIAFQK